MHCHSRMVLIPAVLLLLLVPGVTGAGEPNVDELRRKLNSASATEVISAAKLLVKADTAPAWEALRKAASNRKVLDALRRPFVQRTKRGEPHAGKNELWSFFTAVAKGKPVQASRSFEGALPVLEGEATRDEYLCVASALPQLTKPNKALLQYIEKQATDRFHAGCFSNALASWGTPESLKIFEARCSSFYRDLLPYRNRVGNAKLYLKLASDRTSLLSDFRCRTRAGGRCDHEDYPPIAPAGVEAAEYLLLIKGLVHGPKRSPVALSVMQKAESLVDRIHSANQGNKDYLERISKHYEVVPFGQDSVLIPKKLPEPNTFKWFGPKDRAALEELNGKSPLNASSYVGGEWGLVVLNGKTYRQVDTESIGKFCAAKASNGQLTALVKWLHSVIPGRAVDAKTMDSLASHLKFWPQNKFPAKLLPALDRKSVTVEPSRPNGAWRWSFVRQEGPELVQYKYVLSDDHRMGRLRRVVFQAWPPAGSSCRCPDRAAKHKRSLAAHKNAASALEAFMGLSRAGAPPKEWRTFAGSHGWTPK